MSERNSQMRLDTLLRELAKTECEPIPAAIETKLLTACRNRAVRSRRAVIVSLSAAACLAVAALAQWRGVRPRAHHEPSQFAGFVALPYAQSDVPMEQLVIVRVDLDARRLSSLGLPPGYYRGQREIRADLLMGQDGVARAIRFSQ